jgi:hypothetical protein
MACAVGNGFPAVVALLLDTGDLHPLARHPQQRFADRWIIRHSGESDTVLGVPFQFFCPSPWPAPPSNRMGTKYNEAIALRGTICESRG